MTVKGMLNAFLLALSLGTVLVTLITFFIYKIRKASELRAKNVQIPLRGVFFERYAPHIKETSESTLMESTGSLGSLASREIVFVLILVVFMIFAGLSAEYYWTTRQLERAPFSTEVR